MLTIWGVWCKFQDQTWKDSYQGARTLCAYCEKSFAHSSAKTTHERSHTKDNPYQCTYCDKAFSHSSSKTMHKRIHTKEQPYQCAYCDTTFTQVTRLGMNGFTPKEQPCNHTNVHIVRRVSHISSAKTTHERTHTKDKLCLIRVLFPNYTNCILWQGFPSFKCQDHAWKDSY